MRLNCVHGYFFLREDSAGEISRLASSFPGLEFVAKDDYFTFSFLKDAPSFSIKGMPYLGTPATVTFSGKPWDVMRANGLVYDFTQAKLVPLNSITKMVELSAASNYYLSPGLILPGSVTDGGLRVTDYASWFLFDSMRFKYSEVSYV